MKISVVVVSLVILAVVFVLTFMIMRKNKGPSYTERK